MKKNPIEIIAGEVTYGRHLGHELGFPTANIIISNNRQKYENLRGVYASRTFLNDGEVYSSVVNVGFRPSVENEGRLVLEAYLIGFDKEIYGQTIKVELYKKLRDETKFDSLSDLSLQINRDVDDTLKYFSER